MNTRVHRLAASAVVNKVGFGGERDVLNGAVRVQHLREAVKALQSVQRG